MPGDEAILARLDHLEDLVNEVKAAITGNETMGHVGIVGRLTAVEQLHGEVPEVHNGIEIRAKDSIQKVHARVDSLERRVDRAGWFATGLALGAGFVGGGVSAWLGRLIG